MNRSFSQVSIGAAGFFFEALGASKNRGKAARLIGCGVGFERGLSLQIPLANASRLHHLDRYLCD